MSNISISNAISYNTTTITSKPVSSGNATSNATTQDSVGDSAAINSSNPRPVTETDKIREILEPVYRSEVAYDRSVCKSDSDLQEYIWKKYQITPLPDLRVINGADCSQRLAMAETEYYMAKYGTLQLKGGTSFVSCMDSHLNGKYNINADVMEASQKLYDRQQVNSQMNSMFLKNGIQIPQNLRLTFTIDPNNYKMKVSGTTDSTLIAQLESILQSGENAGELFKHIIKSAGFPSKYNQVQFTDAQNSKYQFALQIKRYTGYSMRDLPLIDGAFRTPDGDDIFNVLKSAVENDSYYKGDSVSRNAFLKWTGNELKTLSVNGYDSVPDMFLSIDWQNGSLYDVGQTKQYGDGETKWIQNLIQDTGSGWFYNKTV
ncbi:hypothetical protein CPAST_c23930 [Clostridium pasteurianum DSM 525 = ATCC 6013]|uniref:Uncharacterized protein n=1 Tax=Clostridium pasteurianum DSM 525 = ATCC 6013 TaxID=1262449 RepID=A0A0H3J8Z2_CLOPA|nr:DUF4885 family protein [Clostridium pasteurianum]AJA48463.1 hypothetical protein CPAST_c23930 [Clostridium pasteurianum DSM 525 = ATCC 6013]AJA52451.1 hypothetical protein CLPA_c23930 [Clostridium pasteurianum DSM 525 = ATCC 6013]AOZ75705.1 hypothetical protein AQ983_11635 [Clostridium pasteurianum DSM 525 = ATCC 6013]AOZ79501.1 hypothetical protein AQ984_11630 [Clostridium pasteurianum]ELP60389.1 hypothetical protein F502_02852 [Clostridium pasteurianum DSM 525 = ATCC 6013]